MLIKGGNTVPSLESGTSSNLKNSQKTKQWQEKLQKESFIILLNISFYKYILNRTVKKQFWLVLNNSDIHTHAHLILMLVATRMTFGTELMLFSRPLSMSTRNMRLERYQLFMLSMKIQKIQYKNNAPNPNSDTLKWNSTLIDKLSIVLQVVH